MTIETVEAPTRPACSMRRWHWLLRSGLVTLLFLLLVAGQFVFAEEITVFWLSLAQPLIDPGAQTVTIAGRALRQPSGPVNVVMTLVALGHVLLIPLLLSLGLYQRLTAYIPRLDGVTRCGNCGYILKGLTEPRCTECGRKI